MSNCSSSFLLISNCAVHPRIGKRPGKRERRALHSPLTSLSSPALPPPPPRHNVCAAPSSKTKLPIEKLSRLARSRSNQQMRRGWRRTEREKFAMCFCVTSPPAAGCNCQLPPKKRGEKSCQSKNWEEPLGGKR